MGLKGCPGHQGPWQTLAASSDPTSVNHKFGAASIATLLSRESEMDKFRITEGAYAQKGGARSEGGEVSRKEVNVSGCVMSRSESGVGRHDGFWRCRSEKRR